MRVSIEHEDGRKIEDWSLDWFEGMKCDGLEPLLPYESIAQPDDMPVSVSSRRRGMCCLCGADKVAD